MGIQNILDEHRNNILSGNVSYISQASLYYSLWWIPPIVGLFSTRDEDRTDLVAGKAVLWLAASGLVCAGSVAGCNKSIPVGMYMLSSGCSVRMSAVSDSIAYCAWSVGVMWDTRYPRFSIDISIDVMLSSKIVLNPVI